MPEAKIPDREANSPVKRSVGYWAAVIAQWFFAIGAGVIALYLVVSIIVQVLNSGNILELFGLLYVAFFSWTAWLSGKLALNIQSGIRSPLTIFSLKWGSALSLTIVTAALFGLTYPAVQQAIAVQERARVSEVVSFIDDINAKQKAFSAKHGRLPFTSSEIGPLPPLKYFTLEYVPLNNTSASIWSIKFTRNALGRNRRYGGYSIVYNSSGTPHYDCVESSNLKACREELIPHE